MENENYYLDPETGEKVYPQEMTVPETDMVMVRADAAPKVMNPNDLPDFDNMEAGFSLANKYVKFTQVGQKEVGVLLGFNQMKSTGGGTKPIAIFQNKQGVWANAGDNLINQIIHLPIGTPVEVKYLGDVKTGGGFTVKTFEVRLLNPKQN